MPETDDQMLPPDNILTSEYSRFKISSESSGYKISKLSGNSGSAGDVMGIFSSYPLTNVSFLTYDRINIKGPNSEPIANSNIYQNPIPSTNAQPSGWWYPDGRDQFSDINSSSGKASLIHKRRCYANLNAAHPVYCDTHGKRMRVMSVKMFVRRM